MTKTLKLFFGLLVGGMVGVCAAPKILPAQQPWQFPRTTGITVAMDTATFVSSDSIHSTKGMTMAQLRKLIGVRAFDSLITANIFRAAGLASLNGSVSIGAGTHFQWAASDTVLGTTFLKDTVKGQPVWLGIPQHLLADSATLADSAIGANRAQILTTARTIGGVSFNGSANTTVATATGGFTVTGGTLAHARDSMSVNTALIFAGADTIFGQPAWNATQAFATGQRVDSATGAARSQILTTARTIGGVSFNGSANTTVATATGGFTVTGGTHATGRDSISANTALVFAGTDTVIGQPAWATNLQHLTADTATLAKNLTGSPAITVSSCSGCSSFPLLAPNGSAAAPDYSYTNSTGLGHYRFGADSLGTAAAGRLATITVDSAFRVTIGRATKPGYGFTRTTDTVGVTAGGLDTLSLVSQGVTSLQVSGGAATKLTGGAGNFNLQCGTGNSRTCTIQATDAGGTARNSLILQDSIAKFQNGRSGQPSIAFNNSATTGIYRIGSDTFGIAIASNKALQIGNNGGGNPVAAFGSGNSTQPSITFFNGTGNGFWLHSSTAIGVISNSAELMVFGGSGQPTITGGAANMTIQAGTGASRSLTLQSTNAGSSANSNVVLNADSTVTFLKDILPIGNNGANLGATANSWGTAYVNRLDGRNVNGMTITGGSGTSQTNLTILAGTGTDGPMVLRSSNHTGTATTFATGAGDTLKFGGHAIATGFTTAAGTPGTVCYNTTTFELTLDNATTCVVSARRFKHDILPLSLADAARIVMGLKPSTFTYNVGGRKAIGLVAEEADSIDSRLGFRNADSSLNSVDYLAIGPVLVRLVQEQQTEISSLSKQLAAMQAQQPAIDSLRIAVALLTKKPASKASAVPTPSGSLKLQSGNPELLMLPGFDHSRQTDSISTMFFGAGAKLVLTITPDGRFILGPGATPDSVAKAIVDVANKSRASAIPRSGVDTLHQRMHQ